MMNASYLGKVKRMRRKKNGVCFAFVSCDLLVASTCTVFIAAKSIKNAPEGVGDIQIAGTTLKLDPATPSTDAVAGNDVLLAFVLQFIELLFQLR